MKIWLDLEDTIITTWDEGLLLHPIRIRNWLDKRQVTDLHIWSFAIYDDADKTFFEQHMKEVLERVLYRPILSWPSILDMMAFSYKAENIKYESVADFIQLNSKHWSFIKYCLAYEKGNNCILIDDAVPNLTITDNKTNTTVTTINVMDI